METLIKIKNGLYYCSILALYVEKINNVWFVKTEVTNENYFDRSFNTLKEAIRELTFEIQLINK